MHLDDNNRQPILTVYLKMFHSNEMLTWWLPGCICLRVDDLSPSQLFFSSCWEISWVEPGCAEPRSGTGAKTTSKINNK